MKKYIFGCGGLIILLVLITLIGGCGSYNRLVGLSQNVNSKWADVQNVYQRRADLIPNLVQTVSGAANFEKSTMVEVTQARASVGQVKIDPTKAPSDPEQLKKYQQAQDQLSGALSRLLVVAEKYPELRATANFRDLQTQLEGTENRIAVERRNFNQAVQEYNTVAQRFPGVIFARIFGYSPKPYFQATAGSETPPKVNFDFGKPTPTPEKP
ncbi:MAG: LemA family protein [Verrucomicrobiota bacterium]|nr:LemA family protein [Verrucomicrobiota bacterium]